MRSLDLRHTASTICYAALLPLFLPPLGDAMRFMMMPLLLALPLGCGDKESDDTALDDSNDITDDSEGDSDTDADSDTDTDTDTDAYTAWEGTESYIYDFDATVEHSCEIVWDTSGGPTANTLCDGCDFGFDLAFIYNAAESVDTDGACSSLAVDSDYSYAYMADYYGYGPALMLYITDYSAWYWFFSAELDDSTGKLDYYYGVVDYAYNGYYSGYQDYYYSNAYVGSATLTK